MSTEIKPSSENKRAIQERLAKMWYGKPYQSCSHKTQRYIDAAILKGKYPKIQSR